MACKDLAENAVGSLLSNLQPAATMLETAGAINTRLIVRQTTGLPKDALSDLVRRPTQKKKRL
jgi:hypothetical protein